MTELKNISFRTAIDETENWTNSDLQNFFYDWFCKDESLSNKAKRLLKKAAMLEGSWRFNMDTTYLFFKNNCPGNGSLYDDFRICDRATGDVIFCVTPSSGHDATRGDAEVWGRKDDGEFGELVRGSWSDVKAFFKMTDDEWAQHKGKMPVSPFQVGVEVRVKGEHTPWGELPKKQIITQVNEQGMFIVGENTYRWFKRDGTFTVNRGRKHERNFQCQLWSEYEASEKAEHGRKARREQIDKLKREVENALYRLGSDGSEETLARWTQVHAFVNALVPAAVKKVA